MIKYLQFRILSIMTNRLMAKILILRMMSRLCKWKIGTNSYSPYALGMSDWLWHTWCVARNSSKPLQSFNMRTPRAKRIGIIWWNIFFNNVDITKSTINITKVFEPVQKSMDWRRLWTWEMMHSFGFEKWIYWTIWQMLIVFLWNYSSGPNSLPLSRY